MVFECHGNIQLKKIVTHVMRLKIKTATVLRSTLTPEAMSNRFFPNPMPEFIPESTPSTQQELQEAVTVTTGSDSLLKLLAMPHAPLSERLKHAALDIKENVLYITKNLAFCQGIVLGVDAPGKFSRSNARETPGKLQLQTELFTMSKPLENFRRKILIQI